ncbi:MAG: hypothetical protein QM737_00065 [Ferruginibacter sp.]
MKKLMIPFILILFYSCEKKDPGVYKNQTNHMEATVVLSSGSTVTFNETGQNVTLGISTIMYNYFGTVINEQEQQVYMSDYGIDFKGGYSPYYNTDNPIRYENDSIPGDTIIYTNINGIHREGNFHFTCVRHFPSLDTVVINGSFKGEFE